MITRKDKAGVQDYGGYVVPDGTWSVRDASSGQIVASKLPSLEAAQQAVRVERSLRSSHGWSQRNYEIFTMA